MAVPPYDLSDFLILAALPSAVIVSGGHDRIGLCFMFKALKPRAAGASTIAIALYSKTIILMLTTVMVIRNTLYL